jgi:hypothetical protein
VLEQAPVHEEIRAANSLHEVEAASVVEKTRQVQRQLPGSGEDGPQDVVLEHLKAAKPKEENDEQGN